MIIIRRYENNKGTFDSQIRELKKGRIVESISIRMLLPVTCLCTPIYCRHVCSTVTFKKNVDNEGTSFPVPIPIHEQWWLTLRFNWITRHEGLSEMCVTVPKKLPTLPLDIRTTNGKCACNFLLRLIFFFIKGSKNITIFK